MDDNILLDVAILKTKVDSLSKTLEEQTSTLKEVRDIIVRSQGAWKTIIILGAVAAFAGGILSKWLIAFIHG